MALTNQLVALSGFKLPSDLVDRNAAIAVCADDFTFIGANQNLASWYGKQTDDLMGKKVFEFYPRFQSSVFFDGANETITSGTATTRIGFSNNTQQWLKVETFRSGKFSVWVAEPLEDLNHSLERDFYRDKFTSLRNEFSLHSDLAHFKNNQSSFGLVYFEVPQVELFERRYGAAFMEKCMMVVASRLRGSTSMNNQTYRINQSMFGMIIPNNRNACLHDIKQATHTVELPMIIDNTHCNIQLRACFVYVDQFKVSTAAMMDMAKAALDTAYVSNSKFFEFRI